MLYYSSIPLASKNKLLNNLHNETLVNENIENGRRFGVSGLSIGMDNVLNISVPRDP